MKNKNGIRVVGNQFFNFSLKEGNSFISRLPSGINIKYLLNKYRKPPIGRRTALNKDVKKVKLILSTKNNSNFIMRILYFAADTLRFSMGLFETEFMKKARESLREILLNADNPTSFLIVTNISAIKKMVMFLS